MKSGRQPPQRSPAAENTQEELADDTDSPSDPIIVMHTDSLPCARTPSDRGEITEERRARLRKEAAARPRGWDYHLEVLSSRVECEYRSRRLVEDAIERAVERFQERLGALVLVERRLTGRIRRTVDVPAAKKPARAKRRRVVEGPCPLFDRG